MTSLSYTTTQVSIKRSMSTVFVNPILLQLVQATAPVEAAGVFADADPNQIGAAREAAGVLLQAMEEVPLREAQSFAREVDQLREAQGLIPVGTALAGVSNFVGQNISDDKWGKLTATKSWLEKRAALFGDFNSLVDGMKTNAGNDPAAAIVQRTAEFRELGVPNAEAVVQVEAKMGFKLNLDPEAIKEKAAAFEKMLHPVTIPVPEMFRQLPDRQQEALILIGKAIRFLDAPFRLQRNPYGDVFEKLMMETPVLGPLRPYYIRFAGVYDPLHPGNFGFLPGMESVVRDDSTGLYPPGMTLENFRKTFPENSVEDREMRAVFRYDNSGVLIAVPLSQAFKEWLEPATELLIQAAGLFEQERPNIANYLRQAAQAYRNNDFTTLDRAWVALDDPLLDMNLGAVEQYTDRLRGHLARLEGILQIKHPELERRLIDLKRAYPQFEEALPVPDEYKRDPKTIVPPPVTVVHTLFATRSYNSEGGTTVAYNQPNDEAIRGTPGGFRIVIMENVMEAVFSNPKHRRMKELAFYPDQQALVTPLGAAINNFLHEEAHGNAIENIVGRSGTDATKALGVIGKTFEELRGDIVGLYNAQTARKLNLISEETLHQIYAAYIFHAINFLRGGAVGDHGRALLVAFNVLRDAGAIAVDAQTGRTRIHFEKMPDAITQLAKTLILVKGKGDQKAAEALYKKFGEAIPQELNPVFEGLKDFPMTVTIHYAFEELLADHPQ